MLNENVKIEVESHGYELMTFYLFVISLDFLLGSYDHVKEPAFHGGRLFDFSES